MSSLARTVLLAACALAGCASSCSGGVTPGREGRPAEQHEEGLARGTIEGVVRLQEGAPTPAWATSPMVMENRELPAECPPVRTTDREPLGVAADRGLSGIVVVATGRDPRRWPGPGEPRDHELVIGEQCRLGPTVLATTRGDRLILRNETDFPFFPETGLGVLQALLRQEPREMVLDVAGVRDVQCAFAAPCGRATVMTFYHPVHTVTGEDGTFRLEGVPADQEISLVAWHPLVEESRTVLTLTAGEARRLELVVRPSPESAPEAPTLPEGVTQETHPEMF